jgi:hypothetical protein
MRDTAEDSVILLFLLACVPIALVIISALGLGAIVFGPILLVYVVWKLRSSYDRHAKDKIREGKIKLLSMPQPIKDVFKLVFKVLFGLLTLLGILFILNQLPLSLSLLVICCFIGFGSGRLIKRRCK